MFQMSHPIPPVNGGLARGPGMNDGGTINPAALSSSVSVSPNRSTTAGALPSPRGVKRSRSPEYNKYDAGSDRQDDDGPAPRKRGRPPKAVKVSESPAPQAPPSAVQTPQSAQHAAQLSPSQASPSKTTPTKAIKALPTVRDHTSMELNEEGDEYIPREFDQEGEKKVAANGLLLGGRQYRCRTFFMPNRGDRLFMLATECAKVLQYRDSYLLFNKNRSLFKIIANQEEKNDLIQQDILPSSYRSRQIAIVTARSMYRQFGSRLVVNGRRVRDDYFESRARKQGFTEEDLAGEKRPGMAKAREAAAAAAATHADHLIHMPPSHIVYDSMSQDGPQMGSTLTADYTANNINMDDFSSVPRPRHEISGIAYHDRTTPSNQSELLSHAAQTAEFNTNIGQQRRSRATYLDEMWRRPHETSPAVQSPEGDVASSQARHSPHTASSGPVLGAQQNLQAHAPQQQHAMLPPQYSPSSLHHNMISQPGRPSPQQIGGSQMHHRQGPAGVPIGPGGYPYGYGPQGQVWGSAAQPQPSPLAQTPMQYGGHVQQPSPHMGGHQALHHPQQMGGPMQNMAAYGGNPAYGNVAGRQMYGASGPGSQQHFIPGGHQPGAVTGTQAGHMQGWPATTQAAGGSQQWQGF